MILEKAILFNDGTKIPVVGLGTWQTPADIATRVVEEGIETGYIHIDTANAYKNEKAVGEGVRKSGIARDKIYITSKVRGEIKNYADAKAQIDESLSNLDLGYIDLMLIHCPSPWNEYQNHKLAVKSGNEEDWAKYGHEEDNLEVWKALEEAVQAGKVRSIGISNFANRDTKNILDHCSIKPVCNQIHYHIGFEQPDVVEYCHENGILIEAYSPIATGELLKNEKVIEMAKKYNVSAAQLSIRYALDKTDIVLPKTTHKEFMIENAKIEFTISDEDKKVLENL